MKKKILIYAHYYVPDVASTGQILQDLAEGMRDAFEVTVICTVPSYDGCISEEYKGKKLYREDINGVNVIRVPVPEFSKSNKLSRIRNLLAYLNNARKATRKIGNQDYIFTISQPPILGGLLGRYGKKIIRTSTGDSPKLIYNIQDFNPEQIEAVGYFRNRMVLSILRMLDNRNCIKSDLVITVGRDLVQTLLERFKGKKAPKYLMINNWIDEKIIHPLPQHDKHVMEFKRQYSLENKFIFMYSGNIGLYYDLEGIIKVISKFRNSKTPDGKDVVFSFVGSGSVLEKLKEYVRINELKNVVFIPYQNKENLIYSLNAADVHLCVNAKGIKGVSCPSKFYGIASVAKPVLSVLEKDSEVQMLITEIGCGTVSEPEDYRNIEKQIDWFISNSGGSEIDEMGKRGYNYLTHNLTKEISINKYITAIKQL